MKQLILLGLLISNLFSQTIQSLDINNIIASVSSDGELFSDFRQKSINSGSLIETASFWLSSTDPSTAIHATCQRNFAKGHEWHFGPLSSNFVNQNYINKYNRVWKIDKSTIDYHNANYNDPNYVIPKEIIEFPVRQYDSLIGNNTYAFWYRDNNENRIYEPNIGEAPVVLGDQSVYFIINDVNLNHEISKGLPHKQQLIGTLFAYKSNDDIIANTVFLATTAANFNRENLSNFSSALFIEPNLWKNDQCHVAYNKELKTSFTYSAIKQDDNFKRPPPVLAVRLMSTTFGILHPKGRQERFISFNNSETRPVQGEPESTMEYYTYMQGRWKDGTPITVGGTGYNPGSTNYTNFLFEGNPNNPISWNEISSVVKPGFRSNLHIQGVEEYLPGERFCSIYAITVISDEFGTNISPIDRYIQEANKLEEILRTNAMDLFPCEIISSTAISEISKEKIQVYPNPVDDLLKIKFSDVGNYKIYFTNLLGQTVKERDVINNAELELSTSDMPSSLYNLVIKKGNELISSDKVLINHK